MPIDYSGLTRNIWPGTWSPSGQSPIALDTELRGGLQSITGGAGDKLTDIYGQRISEGMLVFLKNGYTAGGYTRTSSTYYTYSLLLGESRSPITGAVPNAEANWSEVSFASNGGGVGSTSTFKYWNVDGNPGLTAEGLDTINFVASTGTSIVALTSGTNKSLTISIKTASSTQLGGIKVGTGLQITGDGTLNALGGGDVVGVIKTFNVVGEFWSPVAGTAAFFVINQTTLRSVNITNGSGAVQEDLMAGLYRNGSLISFFTLPAGYQNVWINTPSTILYINDRLTVSMVAGRGNNYSMTLLNIEKT